MQENYIELFAIILGFASLIIGLLSFEQLKIEYSDYLKEGNPVPKSIEKLNEALGKNSIVYTINPILSSIVIALCAFDFAIQPES